MSTNYIFDKNPQAYGNNQTYYLSEVSRVVRESVSTVKRAVENKLDLTELFFVLLEKFREERSRIAVNTGTNKAECFGLRRDSDRGVLRGYSYTLLEEKYSEYGAKMCALFQSILAKMPHDLKKFETTSYSEEAVSCGRNSSFQLEILDREALEKKMWTEHPDGDALLKLIAGKRSPKEGFKHLKMAAPAMYTQDKMHFFLTSMEESYPSKEKEEYLKSHWVLATSRCEIEGKMYALSLYLTYMYFNDSTDPVERMAGRSKITIIHQDAFLIEGTLKEISKLFEKVVRWDSKTEPISLFKERMGLFRYLFAHTMPFVRGSAAIGEWFQEMVCDLHGLTAGPSNAEKACDLEALTARSLGDFMSAYNEITELVLKTPPMPDGLPHHHISAALA